MKVIDVDINMERTNLIEQVVYERSTRISVAHYWDIGGGKLVPFAKDRNFITKKPVKVKIVKSNYTQLERDWEDYDLYIDDKKIEGWLYKWTTFKSGLLKVTMVVGAG